MIDNKGPLYGDVNTRLFQKGETGLLDTKKTQNENVSTEKKPPEWEKFLQYGLNGKTKRKLNKPPPPSAENADTNKQETAKPSGKNSKPKSSKIAPS